MVFKFEPSVQIAFSEQASGAEGVKIADYEKVVQTCYEFGPLLIGGRYL